MGDGKIDFRSAFCTVALSCTLAASLSFFLVGAASANSSENATFSRIEQRLFQKTYDRDAAESRLARIEKQVFGQSASGGLDDRLQRVLEAIGPQKNPDGSLSGIRETKPPAIPERSAASPSAAPGNEDNMDAVERAQLAVQAAREESINKLLDQGVRFWRAKQSAPAIEKFEEVLRLDPHNAQALFSVGIVYESSRNYIEALSCYQRAAKENPTNKEYADALAAIQKKANLKQFKQDKQGQLKTLAVDAKAAYDRGEFISALGYYKEMDDKVPNQALIKYNIGTCYMAVKNPFNALQYYKQARKLKPDEPRYITACEQLEANLTRAQEARDQAEQAYDDSPQQRSMQANQERPKSHKFKSDAPSAPAGVKIGLNLLKMGLIAKGGKNGVIITTVGIASRAQGAGLLSGDVIKAVDGTVVNSVDEVNTLLSRKSPEAQVHMTVQRGKNLGQVNL